jgi:hypothetical protein
MTDQPGGDMKKKWIRVMGSHDSDGLWTVDPPRKLDPKSLPISDALKLRLADWVHRWRYVDLRGSIAELDECTADGLKIAKALKAELPDYKVHYHDWAAHAQAEVNGSIASDDPAAWDGRWDYEISL